MANVKKINLWFVPQAMVRISSLDQKPAVKNGRPLRPDHR